MNSQLFTACKDGDLSIVKAAVEANPWQFTTFETDSPCSPFHQAIVNKRIEIVEYLLNHCPCDVIDKMINQLSDDCPGYSRSPSLPIAFERGSLECVKLLLDHGASIHDVDEKGSTVAACAASGGHMHLLLWLAENYPDLLTNIDANQTHPTTGSFGFTALRGAAYSGHFDCVKYCIERGADPFLPNGWGGNSITAAISNNHKDIAKYLIDIAISRYPNKLFEPIETKTSILERTIAFNNIDVFTTVQKPS